LGPSEHLGFSYRAARHGARAVDRRERDQRDENRRGTAVISVLRSRYASKNGRLRLARN